MAPRMKVFKPGSILYFMGDKSDSVFLLKEGKVVLEYNDIQTGEEQTDYISSGEFFGVKSGLIRFQREETAKVMQNSTIIEFPTNDFEALITKNTSIILKMLKVFSNQLRKIGKEVQSLVTNSVSSDTTDEFFNIGEYYLKNKKYTQAITVYNRYLQYYPDGKKSNLAKKRVILAQNSLNSYGEGGGPALFLDDDSDNVASSVSPSSVSMDSKSPEETIYYKGVACMGSNKYGEAFNEFKKVMAMNNNEYKILASFEIGRCLFFVHKYKECIQQMSSFISKNQKFNDIGDVLYYIGSSYLQLGERQKATEIYNKILAMENQSDDIYRKVSKALKEM